MSGVVGGYGFDTRDFRKLVRNLRLAEPEVARWLRTNLRAAGELVAVEARSIAGEHSKQIPPTIKVRTAGPRVEVRAGGRDVPIARLYELGNKGSGDNVATFRHPVFGDREAWVAQPRYPFLKRAGVAKKAEASALVARTFSDLSREIARGLHSG